uniref:G-protein coupled receptors family 2 profile 2 domain-containing protein n=1 Tax=Amphimedon queenslandica TaxID=400682 RepID=A0A1X7U434_AMPQE
MDNDSNTSNCVDGNREEIIIIEEVFGGLGVITCTVALVFAIVSRFYKDIVQRLILYKLIAMLVYSLSLFMFFRFDDSNIYKASAELAPIFAYNINLILTFWLTIILYLCIVHLKKLKTFGKLEPIAILSSFLPLVGAVIIPFTSYDDCTITWEIKFSEQGTNKLYYYFAISYIMTVLIYIVLLMLVTIIFIVTVRRSRLDSHQRKNEEQANALLVTNNKWKMLSKQLLPLVVYPIVNTVNDLSQ